MSNIPKLTPELSEKQKKAFFSKIRKDKKCWNWIGHMGRNGYGIVSLNSKSYKAHRVSLFLHKNENKRDLVLHSCNNPSCVKPEHLRYGTHIDNSKDCIKSGNNSKLKKTHCLHGHPLSGENLRIIYPNTRKCRICARIIFRKYRKARRIKEREERLLK